MTAFQLVGALTGLIAVFGYLNYRFIKLPDTVGITAVGLIFSLVLSVYSHWVPEIGVWARETTLAIDFPEVIFHGMLGMLLFAASLHVNISDLSRLKTPIVVLSTVGVVLSTAVVGIGAHTLFWLFGVDVPLVFCLLFGALISPTDPVAVLGLLKTAGVSKSLETKISGESLFNDGTGVVAYLVLLGIAAGTTTPTAASVSLLLVKEIVGAVLLGLAAGYLAVTMLKALDSYAVELLITLSLATGGYALAEHLHVSAPIAVVVMGLYVGNRGARTAMTEKTRQHLFSFWELIDEVLTLVLFGLIGIQVVALTFDVRYLPALVLAIPLVLTARFVSVGLPMMFMRRFHETARNSVKIMTWGGLRGGISIALALSLPPFPSRDLIILATYGVVLFSLLVQAPTLPYVLRALKADKQSRQTATRAEPEKIAA